MELNSNEQNPEKIKTECINVLYQQSRIVLLSNLAASTVLSFILLNHFPSTPVIIWLTSIYTLSVIRYFLAKEFHKSEIKSGTISKWGNYFLMTTIISGILWGSTGYLFFDSNNLLILFFLTLSLTGTLVASLPSLSSVISTYYGFAIPALLPLIYKYLTHGSYDFILFGTLIFVFLFTQLAYARIHNKTLIKSIILRFENTSLINKLKKQNIKSSIAQKNAELANTSKTKFFAAASHDLRQPLQAMSLFLGVLENEISNKDHNIIVDKIKRSNNALKGLLDGLLDISRIEAGVIQTEIKPFAIQDILDSLWHEFKSYADEKNLYLNFIPTKLWASSDRRVIERILRNLISNAIRYTNQGGVVVGCRRKKDFILLSVYDTGIGIPEDRLNEIFIEFHQLNNSERDRDKGLGLGLAIVSRLAELLKAPIHYNSIHKKGSMFSLELLATDPVLEPDNKQQPPSNISLLAGKNILIVDDEENIQDGLTRLLSSWGCTAIAAATGNEAIQILQKKNFIPDLILVDYRLRDGEKGTDVIRKINNLYTNIKHQAIIITGDTEPERIIEANASGYKLLHKPLSASKLRALINYVLIENKE